MASNNMLLKPQMPNIPGTKPATRNAQLLVSTGIPSLDHFIGGGLPVGSMLLIQEDLYNLHSKIIIKYFVAEGVVSTHSVMVASQDVQPSDIINGLPAVVDTNLASNNTGNEDEQMKIAWRYQNMKIVDSSPTDNMAFGHYYDLTKTMSPETVKSANIFSWDGAASYIDKNEVFKNPAYTDLLTNIRRQLTDGRFLISDFTQKRNILRIAIHSLGSRMWLSDQEEDSNRDLFKFMYCLKALLRESLAVAVVTIPTKNFDDSTITVERLEHLSDMAIDLESFAGSSKETNPIFKDYHGLLHVKKLPAFNTLNAPEIIFTDLAYKLRRKKFLIQILHLPPEFGDTVQREQDDTVSVGCGSATRNSKLDF